MARWKVTCLILSLALLYACVPPMYRNGTFRGTVQGRNIVYTARQCLGVPYRHGGDTPRGFDCSGLVMYVYHKNGISIPRSTEKQYDRGARISLRRAQPGDLIFYRTEGNRISHVGIYCGDNQFIHAPRTGKQVSFSDIRGEYWRKRFVGAVTYFYR